MNCHQDNTNPLISIIINNFNYGKYVGLAIESALNQTYQKIEVIIVDDGSTDSSRAVIGEFQNRAVAIFKENGGQGSAFNRGLEASSGQIVMFLDSDDELDPNAATEIAKSWGEGLFSKIQFSLRAIDEDGLDRGYTVPSTQLAEGDVLPEMLKRGSYATAPTSGNAFARSFLKRVMPIPEKAWRSHADCYLIHLAPFYGKIGRMERPLGKYRVHKNTLSLSACVINGRSSAARLRVNIQRDANHLDLIRGAAKEKGHTIAAENFLNGYCHYKFRLAAFKLDPKNYPFVGDTLWSLVGTLIKKAWNTQELRPQTKAAFTVWSIMVALLPPKLADAIIIQGVSPDYRIPILSRIKIGKAALAQNT